MRLSTDAELVLLFGDDSEFINYVSFQLATIGLRTHPVTDLDHLQSALADAPALVLVHWDTLRDATFRACATLKPYLEARGTPVAILSEALGADINILTAFSSGADALIDGANNPRIFLSRVRALLGRRGLRPSARSGARA